MPNLSDLKQETYLGDGLYASFDEYGIKMRTYGLKLRTSGGDCVYLTMGETLPAFLAYIDDLKIKLSQHLKDQAVSEEK